MPRPGEGIAPVSAGGEFGKLGKQAVKPMVFVPKWDKIEGEAPTVCRAGAAY
jgi:hypothetical protein